VFAPNVQGEHQVRPYKKMLFDCELVSKPPGLGLQPGLEILGFLGNFLEIPVIIPAIGLQGLDFPEMQVQAGALD
jgi:hypothetical protein